MRSRNCGFRGAGEFGQAGGKSASGFECGGLIGRGDLGHDFLAEDLNLAGGIDADFDEVSINAGDFDLNIPADDDRLVNSACEDEHGG